MGKVNRDQQYSEQIPYNVNIQGSLYVLRIFTFHKGIDGVAKAMYKVPIKPIQ